MGVCGGVEKMTCMVSFEIPFGLVRFRWKWSVGVAVIGQLTAYIHQSAEPYQAIRSVQLRSKHSSPLKDHSLLT